MKTRATFLQLLVTLLLCASTAFPAPFFAGLNFVEPVTPGAFVDDFNRSNGAVGSDWSVESGTFDISSNAARMTSSGVDAYCIRTASVGNVNQYVRIQVSTGQQQYPGFILRFTDSSSPLYRVYFSPDGGTGHTVYWDVYPSVGGSATTVDFQAGQTWGDTEKIGVTMTGTVNSAVIRIFYDAQGVEPISGTEWDSGSTPAVTLTPNIDLTGIAADTGTRVGFGIYQTSANALTYNEASGGPL
jgi:hypothetical protein